MKTKEHEWSYFRSAGLVQVKIENGDDVSCLRDLDQKAWTALAAPVAGLRFDAPTLKFLDADGDGRIRAPEVLAAVEWLRPRLKSFDVLFARKGSNALSADDIDASTPEGAALAKEIALIAKAAGKDGAEVSIGDVLAAEKAFSATPFNGDGVVTADSLAGDADAIAAFEAATSVASVPDRSGKPGLGRDGAEAFFAGAAARLAWKAARGKDAMPLGDATPAAAKAYSAVAAKIDDFFTRCRVAAFDVRAADALNGDPAAVAALAAGDLSSAPEALAAMPLAAVSAGAELPLGSGVNPYWAAAAAAFAHDCARPALGRDGDPETLSESAWAEIKAKLAPYLAWSASEPAPELAAVPEDTLRRFAQDGGKAKAAILAAVAKDEGFSGEYDGIVDAERAVRYASNLVEFLRNFVNQSALYSPDTTAIYQTGVLYIDSRACALCFHVDDVAAHAAQAGKSNCCVVYLKLARPSGAVKERTVCAAVTAGFARTLWTGRNAVFYDRDGNDWDATVVQICEAQVSLREAFWAPWEKIGSMVSGQINKILASRESEAMAKAAAATDAAAAKVESAAKKDAAAPAASAPKDSGAGGAALASSVAAIGIGVGMLGAAFAGIAGFVAGMPWWKTLLGVCCVVLAVSLPSVAIAWFKLRKRDIGTILNACGWAVNRPLRFPMRLSRVFTREMKAPPAFMCSPDPYAPKHVVLTWILVALAAAAGILWALWSRGALDGCLPECMQSSASCCAGS